MRIEIEDLKLEGDGLSPHLLLLFVVFPVKDLFTLIVLNNCWRISAFNILGKLKLNNGICGITDKTNGNQKIYKKI